MSAQRSLAYFIARSAPFPRVIMEPIDAEQTVWRFSLVCRAGEKILFARSATAEEAGKILADLSSQNRKLNPMPCTPHRSRARSPRRSTKRGRATRRRPLRRSRPAAAIH